MPISDLSTRAVPYFCVALVTTSSDMWRAAAIIQSTPRARLQARHPTHSLMFMGSQRRESEHSHRAEQEARAKSSNSRASGTSGEAPRACSLACREGSWLGTCCVGQPGAPGSHTCVVPVVTPLTLYLASLVQSGWSSCPGPCRRPRVRNLDAVPLWPASWGA